MTTWQEIKNKLSVEQVLSQYLNIEPAGANFKCVCPFHNESTPSMMISTEKQIWHCFGCGAGGDIFKFVEDYENLTSKEALEKLAKQAGVGLNKNTKINTKNTDIKDEFDEILEGYKLLTWTAKTYNKILLNLLADRLNPVTKYCIERGLSTEIINKFQLGYAPKHNIIVSLAQKYKLNNYLLFQTGVLTNNKQSVVRDKFIDRLIIPIANTKGQIVGFTGRVLPWDKRDRPKYLNSPQSNWFNKSNIWFGLYNSKNTIFKSKEAVIVEGNMDVIAAHQKDIQNTIASQGTSFTNEQINILKRTCKKIIIAFDNDNAGLIASDKLFITAIKNNLVVYKYIIPEEFKDLDEYLQNIPDTSIHKQIPYLDYKIKFIHKNLISKNTTVQKDSITDFLNLLSICDQLTIEQYLAKISEITGISKTTLSSILENTKTLQTRQKLNKKEVNIEDFSKITVAVEKEKYTTIYNSFQKLIAGDISRSLLEKLFQLLKVFIIQIETETTYSEFEKSKKIELEFVKDIDKVLSDKNYLKTILASVMSFLDQNLNKFILDEQLKAIYLEVKEEVKFLDKSI
jgi:DNA primase